MNLDANDLILFARVIEAGSFTRAAERVGLPKSTLSRRISTLENHLEERLLIRSTRRLKITEFGERILDHANRIIEEAESASAVAMNRQEKPSGILRVSMPPDFADYGLTPMLLEFSIRYPDVCLELDLSPRRVDLVAENFDLAVRAASKLPDDSTLVARKLSELTMHLYASPAYLNRYGNPREPDDLQDHVCLRLVGSMGNVLPWRLSNKSKIWEGLPNGQLSSNSLGLQRELATHGMGIVGLVDNFAGKWVEKGLLQQVLPDWELPRTTVWCITHGRRLLPTKTQAFIEMLRFAFGNE